ncbi:beta-lactamase family protein [Saccharopolyspora erythraea NRRL 2338]|uniref:Beta-lactamase n=2 Tax=Saccharopolyspora erythraea TaxID=1836 RepID=A4FA79_SACEN|nr:serine hydrolase [Saccharopolyspora erythraea]EQD83418.1 hypothetical protein N599_25405 [Saccharopolyspora erythraea D]PFG94740.1 beta-lactamase family protein [Saccharopolyspora erythraea NRRL 2338]QRK91462.1 serine hydrolase [Saccharopolyspora erythraea]CAM00954.1 hypothetical protein SACE_1635 [Saccharopolyspora erythraea NRRL 2338]
MPAPRRTLSRRSVLTAAAAAVPALALAPHALGQPAAPPDLSTPDGWLSWISTHRDGFAIVLDDGLGARLSHRPRQARPLASAVKVIHLAAYATAVAEGRLDPDEQIRVGDWERFYVPTDGGGHIASLGELGIPTDPTGLYAADPNRLVTLEQMMTCMIKFSDSAAPDFLRVRLGEGALRRAARDGGWPDPDLRSLCAEYLFLLLPEHAPPQGAPVPARRRIGYRLERRFSSDAAFRQMVKDRILHNPLPPEDVQNAWAAATAGGAASSLFGIHRSIATGAFPNRRAAGIAQRILELPLKDHLPPGLAGIGMKGGSLPGSLTCGLSVRRADGTVGAGALLAHGDISLEQITKGDPGVVLLLALTDPAWRDRLARALRG